MTKKLQIANGFALVFTIIFNYVSNTGIFNGKTIGNVSDQYHTLITPAGYAFSIWGLIYLLLLGFVIYTGKSLFYAEKNETDSFVEKVGWWFVISCLANCAWIVVWLYGFSGISVLILVIALISLIKILLEALK
ncbi:MAG: tryptophan-rich sensory protein, partial [Kaistella sp.]